jgi:uncharacterized caspase-like protein
VALIVGNSAYSSGQLPTTHADAGVVAQTMRAAGYDVTEADDVHQADIGPLLRSFLDKVTAAGPDAVAFVYYAGQAAQASNENFLVPVDAQIVGGADLPAQALRLGELIEALAAVPAAARIIVLDASRDHGYGRGTADAVAPGLAIMEAPAGMLIASAAAPGQIAAESGSQYSLYTATLVTLMRQPGLDLDQIFKTARAQVNQATGGRQTPWTALGLTVDVTLFPAEPNAPPVTAIPPKGERDVTKGMLSQLSPDDAYQVAIEEDSLQVYQWFVELFPKYQYAAQIWDVIAQRRDELLWSRAVAANTRQGYWNYLERYPNGIHSAAAQQALYSLNAARLPPPDYQPQPVMLPPDYYDEGLGIGEIFPDGFPVPPPVFDDTPPEFVPPPPVLPPFAPPPHPPKIVLVNPPPTVVKPPAFTPKHRTPTTPTTPTTPSNKVPSSVNHHSGGVRPPSVTPVSTKKPPKFTGPHKPETPKTPKIPPPGPHHPVTTPTIPPVPGPHPVETTPPGPHHPETTPTVTPPPPSPHPVTTPTTPPPPKVEHAPPPKVVRPTPPPPKVVRPAPPPPRVVRPAPPPPRPAPPPRAPTCRMVNGKKVCG